MKTQPIDSVMRSLSNDLNRKAGLYSLAAAAAGVSLLALAQPAAAEVVVTKKTIHIPVAPRSMPEPVRISMANNGVDNFSFILSSAGVRELLVGGLNPGQNGSHNQIIAGGDFYGKALALERGAKVGPAGPSSYFSSFFPLVEGTNTSNGKFYSRGYWGGNRKNSYLGVRFLINGQTHYGWIRLTVTTNVKSGAPSLEATITGYAYETVANKPIKAGTAAMATAEIQGPQKMKHQTGPSLGMLAAGAEGLTVWRREETSGR